ncbi:MAG: rhodanese-like domain-containing protein [Succinivibrio sp.]
MLARVKKLNSNAANVMINRENGVYVDVRVANLFSKGHIAGSVNIPLSDVKSGKLARIDSYKDKPVIVVGKDKMDSDCFNAVVSLKKQGYTKVFSLEGGIAQWSMDNLPLSVKS